jgi:RNA polymerase sigma-70 factor (ECF subfamily)
VGDQAETVSRQYARIFAFLRRKTGDADRAAELTQEVFLGAARALEARGRETADDALLFRIAQRRFVDHARRLGRRPRSISLEDAPQVAAPGRYPATIAQALRSALGRLSPEQRQLVAWKLFEGRSFADIAARTGATEPACRTRFRRALVALRTALEEEGFDHEDR